LDLLKRIRLSPKLSSAGVSRSESRRLPSGEYASPFRRQRLHQAAYHVVSRVRIQVAGRHAIRRQAGRALKGLGAGVGYAAIVEPKWVEATHLEVDIAGLPPALEGYRIVHLTDIHYNMVSGRRFLQRIIDRSNSLDPDIYALTGDFVTHNPDKMEHCLELLSHLKAPDGVLATRGNHDYGVSLEGMRSICGRAGIRLLENQHVVITPHRHRTLAPGRSHGDLRPELVFAGVGDLWEGMADPGMALEGAPRDAPRVLLSHNPQVAEIVSAGQQVALQLSGHTHGGQIRPFNRSLRVFTDGSSKYVSGLVRAPHTAVYVSRGVGTSAFYMRWNCRPEIALITLRSLPNGADW
jgi:predicted MPP superfamily phosphohydrolase